MKEVEVEEVVVNFEDGSQKEMPLASEIIQGVKHIAALRNAANAIKLAVTEAAEAVKKNDILQAGRELEKINGLAEFIIENS